MVLTGTLAAEFGNFPSSSWLWVPSLLLIPESDWLTRPEMATLGHCFRQPSSARCRHDVPSIRAEQLYCLLTFIQTTPSIPFTSPIIAQEMNQIRLVAKTKSVRSIFTIARPRQLITPLVVASARPCHGFLPLHQRNTVYSLNPITSQRYFSSTVFRGNDDHENYIYEDDWIEWFAGVEYQSASLGFDALDNVKLDRSSRFLIQQLQDLYHGIVRQYDRPTTEQCNKVSWCWLIIKRNDDACLMLADMN